MKVVLKAVKAVSIIVLAAWVFSEGPYVLFAMASVGFMALARMLFE